MAFQLPQLGPISLDLQRLLSGLYFLCYPGVDWSPHRDLCEWTIKAEGCAAQEYQISFVIENRKFPSHKQISVVYLLYIQISYAFKVQVYYCIYVTLLQPGDLVSIPDLTADKWQGHILALINIQIN